MAPPVPALRLHGVQAPIIPEIAALSRAHPGTISLGQGMVGYGPPEAVIASLQSFGLDPAHHRYGPVAGTDALRELITSKLARENGISLLGRSLVVTAGANMGFLNALFAITDPGDEVILPLPFYFNQEMAIRMVGCAPVTVPTAADFQPDVAAIRAAITPRTRAVVTISPNNPTGAVYSEHSLRAVNDLCRDAGIYHISDEAYENFVYDGARHFSPGAIEGSQEHTVCLYSLSKAYGFAGWRIGYMTIPHALVPAVEKVQDTNLICPPVVSQHAAIAALQVGSGYCRERLVELASVRALVLDELAKLGHRIEVPITRGAFYLFLKVTTDLDSLTLVRRLIEAYRVAAIPGVAFGASAGCWLRVAYGSLDRTNAEEGARRLVQGLRNLAA
ncbi:MAG: pyridoxal phosphate-dependent aminotransferase [Methylococcaceae bacterium]|nr:pyridoxal phosphate-dependent aminotransferase [Methylococcaceae bacterium]